MAPPPPTPRGCTGRVGVGMGVGEPAGSGALVPAPGEGGAAAGEQCVLPVLEMLPQGPPWLPQVW
jgi:hypothetical protein